MTGPDNVINGRTSGHPGHPGGSGPAVPRCHGGHVNTTDPLLAAREHLLPNQRWSE
ncbi:hypothetical protein [Streptosporangium sp. NPDC051022]|uniref:hypothetical protein n=1 Tax=Streptosporangium sp. NPDC051022 TaxID=3155752 RepID=UPI003438A17F